MSIASEVDPAVWRAIAGASVQIPELNSYVYYFPQGHLEQYFAAGDNYLTRPMVPCRVLSLSLLSDPSDDRAFVKFILQPLDAWPEQLPEKDTGDDEDDDERDVVSYAKVLTPSDANNGGGFSVPRYCADLIFPPLDFTADPPVQNLVLIDTHRNEWRFRHIYRGTPRRHLLTTGWSKFVNAKSLIAGDSVVFMKKKSTKTYHTGIRRAARGGGSISSIYDCGENSSSSIVKEALEAMQNVAKGMAFEVVYYPRVGLPDFVVSAIKVEDSLQKYWSPGMRVKMAVETEDSSRLTWFLGTLAAKLISDCGPWRGSPWRMLQITWDEPELLVNMNRLNPWEIDCVQTTSQPQLALPAPKKIKTLQTPEMITNGEGEGEGEGEFSFPIICSMAEQLNSPMQNYSPFPAGMQGARRDEIWFPSLSNYQSPNSHQTFTQLLTNGMEPEQGTVSNVLNVGKSLSPGSQDSVHAGADLVGQHSSTKIGRNSFMLFGKIIQMPEPVEGGHLNNHVTCRDDVSKEVYQERDATDNPRSPRKTSAPESKVTSKEPEL